MSEFKISNVSVHNSKDILAYVRGFRKQLFPMLDHNIQPQDLLLFNKTYIEDELGVFLQVENSQENLIGVIGMSRYDHRFPYFNYEGKRVVEVARLHIEPQFRRQGAAAALVNTLVEHAKTKKIDTLYLHTHPFLTGAFEFWKSQGFKQIAETEEGGFVTIHMERHI